jgi:DNA-binding MarR family transcriptional regulator
MTEAADSPRRPDPRQATQAWESLFRAQVSVMRRLQADDIWQELSWREYDVLVNLSTADAIGMRLRDLNERIVLSQPSLSRMVERLEARGLVLRTASIEDARGTLVRITAEGRRLQKIVGRRHVQSIAAYVGSALCPEDLAELTRLTGLLRAAQAQIPDQT